ncbi:MAG: hypothetical protein FWF01_00185 [Alphaproteobacteria bacterium]|nr:hypothetical protein [Alphaproteobacteria bacterium]
MRAAELFKWLVIVGFMTALMTFAFSLVAWNIPYVAMKDDAAGLLRLGFDISNPGHRCWKEYCFVRLGFDIFNLDDLRFVFGELRAGRIRFDRLQEWVLAGSLVLSIIGGYFGSVRLLAVDWKFVFGRLTAMPRRLAAKARGLVRRRGKSKSDDFDLPAAVEPQKPKKAKDDDARRPAERPAPSISHGDMSFIPAGQPPVAELPDPVPIPDIPYAAEAAPHVPMSRTPAVHHEEKPRPSENTAQADDSLPSIEGMLAEKGWRDYRHIALGEYENCYAIASADGVVLIIDDDKEGEWLADTDELNDPDALWYSETGYRNSPVSLAKRAHDLLVSHVGPRAACLVVETVGVITNTDEMAPVWASVAGQINVCRADNGRGYPDELESLADLLPENTGGESPFESQMDEIIENITNELKG